LDTPSYILERTVTSDVYHYLIKFSGSAKEDLASLCKLRRKDKNMGYGLQYPRKRKQIRIAVRNSYLPLSCA